MQGQGAPPRNQKLSNINVPLSVLGFFFSRRTQDVWFTQQMRMPWQTSQLAVSFQLDLQWHDDTARASSVCRWRPWGVAESSGKSWWVNFELRLFCQLCCKCVRKYAHKYRIRLQLTDILNEALERTTNGFTPGWITYRAEQAAAQRPQTRGAPKAPGLLQIIWVYMIWTRKLSSWLVSKQLVLLTLAM